MASNRDESHPPPRKSRRLASMSSRESVQTPLAGNVQNSVQSQFNELLTAAIPTITQVSYYSIATSGIISNTNQPVWSSVSSSEWWHSAIFNNYSKWHTGSYSINRSISSATWNAYLSGYKCLCKFIHSHFPAKDMHSILSNITEDVLIYFVSHCYSVLKLKYSTIKLYLAGVCHCSLSTLITACIVAFFGCGEFICKQTFDPSSNLTVNVITPIFSEQLPFVLKPKKTDVFRKCVIIKLFKRQKYLSL